MFQSEVFFAEAPLSDKNMMQLKDHHQQQQQQIQQTQQQQQQHPVANITANMDLNYVNLLRENFELRERNNQLIKLNNTLMIEISQLKLEIDMLELKKALSNDDR
jgi:hypothetical protein